MKYTLSADETMVHEGVTLHRIIYADGLKGGWLEGEHNLWQKGHCAVHDEAKVFGKAKVLGNAQVFENAVVCDRAIVTCEAKICGDQRISGRSYYQS